jgi:hypothetical protein
LSSQSIVFSKHCLLKALSSRNYLQKGRQKKTRTSTKGAAAKKARKKKDGADTKATKKKDGADTKATKKKDGADTKATKKKDGADTKAKAATQANGIYHVVWLVSGCLL